MTSYEANQGLPERFGVTVVITSFKDQGQALNCVDSVLRSRNSNPKIVVVDCMSTDMTSFIKQRYKDKVHLVQLSSDVGVAEQRNLGFRNSASKSGYFLFLDNDTEVEESAIVRLTEAAKKEPQCSIFQPRIVSYTNREKTLEIGLASNIFGIPKPIREGEVEPFFASGSGMLVRNDVLLATGGFDAAFHFGAEELDLIWRARLLGYHVRTTPEAVIYHKTEGTRKRLSADRLYLGLRNTIRMQLKNYGCPVNLLMATLFVARSAIEGAVLLFVSKALGSFKDNVAFIAMEQNKFPDITVKFLSAISWNLRNLKDTIAQHARIQSTRIVADRVILAAMKKNDFIYISPAYKSAA